MPTGKITFEIYVVLYCCSLGSGHDDNSACSAASNHIMTAYLNMQPSIYFRLLTFSTCSASAFGSYIAYLNR